MENKEQNEEKGQVPYQFTASPLNLMYILDSDCLKMLNLFIQEESYWRSKGQLADGYFFKSINDLKDDMFMSNDQDVRLTIEALYVNEIIDVINQGDGHKASRFKINLEKIKDIDSKSILEVKKFYPRICKLKRGHVCSYMKREDCTDAQNREVGNASDICKIPESTTNCTTDCHTTCTTDCTPECSPTCTPKLDKSNLLNKSDSSNKLDYNNIIDNNIINNENVDIESFHPLSTEIGNKEKGKVDINNKQIIDASAPQAAAQPLVQKNGFDFVKNGESIDESSTKEGQISTEKGKDQSDLNEEKSLSASALLAAAQPIDLNKLEERLNNYLEVRPVKTSISMRVMDIKKHFNPDEYEDIDRIVRRIEFKHYNIGDSIMKYLTA